jgi:hypothetical protein
MPRVVIQPDARKRTSRKAQKSSLPVLYLAVFYETVVPVKVEFSDFKPVGCSHFTQYMNRTFPYLVDDAAMK